jgi:hypothetical protein
MRQGVITVMKNSTRLITTSALSIAILMSTLSPNSYADSAVYNFGGGSCPTQGAWTQAALAQARSITSAIEQLQGNPDCDGIQNIGKNITAAASAMAPDPTQVQTENRFEAIPAETDALRKNAMGPDGNPDPEVSNMLLHRNLEAAGMVAAMKQNSSSMPSVSSIISAPPPGLSAFFTKYAVTTNQGLELVTDVMQALPKYDRCLMGKPNLGLAVMSGAVKIAASLSASGSGVGDKLGNALMGLMTMMRDRKFTQALRKQDETEFWFSISCMLEGATKNYCDAENAEELLSYQQNQYESAMKTETAKRTDPNYDNPLEGYYLLVRELPIIQTWLQSVQFGATPRLGTDANFKNQVWTDVNNLTQSVNRLIGNFNEQIIFFQQLPDVTSKQNLLAHLVEGLVAEMTNSDNSKFFTTTINDKLLPYYLLGLSNVPPECINSPGRQALDFGTWMRNGGPNQGFVVQFNDPDKLIIIVQQRMMDMVGNANAKASDYFRSRLVVDTANLVNETLTGTTTPVRKSMENVYNYLIRFEKRVSKDKDYYIMLPSIRNTRMRLKNFLTSYNKLNGLGEQMALNANAAPLTSDDIDKAAKEVIDSAFIQFNMLLQKDTFLTTRLSTFIEKDFSMRVRDGANMTSHQQSLMLITQKHLMEKLTEVNGLNPTSAETDLAMAQVINKRNIDTMEEIFGDSIYRMILEVKAVATGKGPVDIENGMKARYNEDVAKLRHEAWTGQSYLPGDQFGLWLTAPFRVRSANPDLYGQTYNTIKGHDDKFKEYGRVQAVFCAQTLAFENKSVFNNLCAGTVVKSFYGNKSSTLDLRYNDFVAKRGQSPYKSRDICAYNNFTIHNYVQWLKDQDQALYDDGGL